MTITSLGMVMSVGISNIRHIDATSPRNMLIIGVSLMLGMMVPTWMQQNPGIIDTGQSRVKCYILSQNQTITQQGHAKETVLFRAVTW
jgi:nucleobase transporter 1/2